MNLFVDETRQLSLGAPTLIAFMNSVIFLFYDFLFHEFGNLFVL